METERERVPGGGRGTHTMFSFGVVKLVLLVGILAWVYQSIQPPPAKKIAAVTAPRIKLRDGRHLAYKELGVPRDEANFKIVYIHGFDSSKDEVFFFHSLSPPLLKELKICIVSFDRPGYGESDPDPNRTPRSIALDVEELADKLELGSKFYVLGFSIGGQITWSCLHYIPHRLAGAALVAPAFNYWWRNLPAKMSKEALSLMLPPEQWMFRVAHYAPWLTFFWNTQKWFPIASYITCDPNILSRQDKEIFSKLRSDDLNQAFARQQGEYESLHRDLMITYGHWEFDPLDLQDLFKNSNGSVHLWHGDEDLFVPVSLQRFIVSKLPWVRYYEVTGSGHFFLYLMADKIVKTLCVGED
ncbi:unnamed protein product [Thlaspi arvense]|uniref:AB hydrolase-1 domain-containing protein n=1 Tax=Thlaspi arvense TaxID=13288 RepID=A0AAU9RK19_THLAR|nr:unnamed protein product [Thlaspi arvense]